MIQTTLHDDVLEIVLDNPPVNAFSDPVRTGLSQAMAAAQDDPKIRAVVIRGSGKLFSGGADITEFEKPMAEPALPQLVDQIEASAKPVVAAINGPALGGGLEVALACHYRLAVPAAKLGLPEVKLGILPGAGGTQRLPRLVGVEQALAMIVSGEPISAAQAEQAGLIDRLVAAEDLAAQAIAHARTVDGPRRTGDRTVTAPDAVFDAFLAANARRIAGLDAPKACVQAVKLATQLPLDQGLEQERVLFHELVGGAQSRALRHAFFAERAAAKVEGLPADTALRRVDRVGVIGAGTMGSGIAMSILSAGVPVILFDMAAEALDRGVVAIRGTYEANVAKGRLTAEGLDRAMGLLTATLELEALKDCDLVIEAVYENMDVKKDMFGKLDAIAKPGAMLASNTSFLSIDEIAQSTARPQDVLGLHFFSPANIMKLVEVIRGARTAPDVLATGMAFARRIGKVPVVSGVCHGFIGNRMLVPRQANADALLLEGATPEQIDRVHTAFGMPMGPYQMCDLAGLDIGWHRDPTRVDSLLDALCAAGRWGQKSRSGFYDYDENRKSAPSAAVGQIIDEFRARAGIAPREISDEEIVVRTLYTMVNEGAHILEEHIAQRASDIDVVWLYGYGWPRHTGGPMFWADQVGLSSIVADLERYADRMAGIFVLSPLLRRCAAEGRPLDR